MYDFSSQCAYLASMTLTSTNDSAAFTPGTAVEIMSWGFVITTALSGTAMVVTADKRVTAGSDTGRVTGAFGTMTTTSAEVTAAVAGKVLRCVPQPAATVDQAFLLLPGQQLVIKPGTAMGSAGAGLPFIEFKYSPYPYQVNGSANTKYTAEIQQNT